MAERYTLPVWIRSGVEIGKLKSAFDEWWDKLESWIKVPLDQMDPETCNQLLLKYYAYQADIDRFTDEPDDMFRKRVMYAEKNAMESGSTTGLVEVFDRLGIGEVEVVEREDEENWDAIALYLTDSQIASNTDLLDYIIQTYGRTCRRYQLTVVNEIDIEVHQLEFGCQWALDVASA